MHKIKLLFNKRMLNKTIKKKKNVQHILWNHEIFDQKLVCIKNLCCRYYVLFYSK